MEDSGRSSYGGQSPFIKECNATLAQSKVPHQSLCMTICYQIYDKFSEMSTIETHVDHACSQAKPQSCHWGDMHCFGSRRRLVGKVACVRGQ